MIKNKKAQSLLEYALIIAVVAVIAVAVTQGLGTQVRNTGQSSVTAVNEASTRATTAWCDSLTGDKPAICN